MKRIYVFCLLSSLVMMTVSSCYHNDKAMEKQKELDSLTASGKLSPELLWKLGRVGDIALSPDGKEVLYGITRYNLKKNNSNTDLFIIPSEGGTPRQLTDIQGSEINGQWRPDGEKIAYLSAKEGSMQVWEMDPDGMFKKAISKNKENINGFLYSPQQDHIVYFSEVKTDQDAHDIYPDLPKSNVRIIDDLMYRHWDSWYEQTVSHLFIAPYDEGIMGEGVDIMAGEPYDAPLKPDGGIEQLCWSPDGTKLAYSSKKLKGKEYALSTNTDIYLYDLTTKKTSNLSQDMMGYDLDPVFSPDGKYLAWRSMETPGYESDKNRIMLYDFATATAKDCSINFDQDASHFQWSGDSKKLYFISGIKATKQICFLDLQSGIIKQVTDGDHDYSGIIVQGDRIIGTKMSISLPTEIFSIEPSTGKETRLTFTNEHILSKITLAKVEKRWIKTTDNKEMLTWVIFPPDFDPSKKYPAILFCAGGPQNVVGQSFSYRWNFQLMAAQGYIVVAPNRRGVPSFGQEWVDQIAGDYGGQNMKDLLCAIDEVAAEPYVDKDHLGAVGASYGGYSVFWLAGHHEKRFKAFIAHCGMFNLESQYAGTEEYFFVNHDLGGPFWNEPKPVSYNYSPHLFVKNWDTPILIITGGRDFRIPYTESFQAFNAAQLKGVPSKLLFFPEESHFVLKPQNSVLWQREFFGWLDKYLKS